MRLLQTLVIIMGVLIFVAMGFLVYGLVTKSEKNAETNQAPPAVAATQPLDDTESEPFDDVKVALPAGASVAWMTVSEGRIIVHVKLAKGGDEIRVFDLGTGVPLGTIRLVPAP